MEELLHELSSRTGVPTDLLERAAAARATALGVSPDAVVAQWTGGEVPDTPPTTPPPPPAEAAASPVAATTPEPSAAAATSAAEPVPTAPGVEVLEPEVSADVEEPADAEPEAEPAAVLSGFPRWLAASFFILPLIALLYALLTPNAPDCGAAGQLAIDPVTGIAENCDGTPYGVEVVNFFSMGEEIYEVRCASCHGSEGGGGVGPAMASGAVVVTFPSCGSHVDWVALGSDGWPDDTYGATNKAVGGSGAAMPAFGEPVLTAEELAAVVLYERVQFGGEPLLDAEEGCGLGGDEVLAGG